MYKSELRKLYRERRQALPSELARQKSLEIVEIFLQNMNLQACRNIHCYLPMLSRNEINTFFLIEKIRANYPQINILSSVTDFKTDRMQTFLLEPDTPIQANKFGIPEPIHAKPFPESEIDLVIIPLLCLDQKGNRIGYGKGHYDRFLSKCPKNTLKIGFSYFPPVPLIEDVEPTDIPLNFAVAEHQFLRF